MDLRVMLEPQQGVEQVSIIAREVKPHL